MDKTLFSILLPASNNTHEFWIPNEMTVHEATELICRILNDIEGRYFISSKTTALYEKSSGMELDVNIRISDLGYVNGTRLVLI